MGERYPTSNPEPGVPFQLGFPPFLFYSRGILTEFQCVKIVTEMDKTLGGIRGVSEVFLQYSN